MKRHVNALFLIVGILLLCVAIAAIMAQTFGHKPTLRTTSPTSDTSLAPMHY